MKSNTLLFLVLRAILCGCVVALIVLAGSVLGSMIFSLVTESSVNLPFGIFQITGAYPNSDMFEMHFFVGENIGKVYAYLSAGVFAVAFLSGAVKKIFIKGRLKYSN